jgi:chromosomal replication initiation ATPase DnaA
MAREEIMRSRRAESRKVCIHLTKKHTSGTNRKIAKLFETLTYSAVAKINSAVSQQLAVDKELRNRIENASIKIFPFRGLTPLFPLSRTKWPKAV